jgi:hypothetical protein
MTTARDPLAILEEIRQRYGARIGDVERLLAGYDALLKLAAEFEEKSARLLAIGDDDYDPSQRLPDRAWTGRAYAYQGAAADLRSVIAAALLGEEVPAS